uniref:Auxin-responsive protein n=1 Tax=Rhizophora mucronata TaxID=61149 RepID=A0A2P2KR90_RHIMU
MAYERDLNLKATELRLGLPGTHHEPDEKQSLSSSRTNKRSSPEISEQSSSNSNPSAGNGDRASAPPTKAHVVGWPPIRSYRKNCLQPKKDETDGVGMYVKVSMDGVPYLRKIDIRVYKNYPELLKALESMFKLTIGKRIQIIQSNIPLVQFFFVLIFFSLLY